jgi:hypothetical protein
MALSKQILARSSSLNGAASIARQKDVDSGIRNNAPIHKTDGPTS